MEELSISEVARRAGLRASAIRYYESIHLLPAPKRINGRRRYEISILNQLSFIQVAQKAGFTINEIQSVFHDLDQDSSLADRWQRLTRKKLIEIEETIQQAQVMKQILQGGMRCQCDNLENCIDCVLTNCGEISE